MYHPSRGGVRGGRDQFSWEDVKGDKHRENYLGHSVKAPVGRWQKGKDLYWYTKEHGSEGPTKEEIKRIQEEEEDAMKEMLGLAPRKNKRPHGNQLDKREVDELLKKGQGGEEQAPSYVDGERVEGLGFAPAPGQIGGQAAGKRKIELKPNDSVSLPPKRISSVGHVKEVEKDVTLRILPPSEDVATSTGIKSRQDVGAVSCEEEAASRKKIKEEKGKATEWRREAKRATREARKVLKDDSGHGSKDRKIDYGRHEDKSRRTDKRQDTSPGYHSQRRKEGYGKARYEGNDSDSNGIMAGRLRTGYSNRKKADYGSSSDVEPFKPLMGYRRSESPDHRGLRIKRQDADRERKGENTCTSSDESAFVKRHRRERKEGSPIRTHQKRRRHDSDSEGYVDPLKEDRRRKEGREESPISPHQKERNDSASDGYLNHHKDDSNRKVKREELAIRRCEMQRRGDSDGKGYVNHRKEDQRRKEKKEESPVRRYEKLRRHDSDSEGYVNHRKEDQRMRETKEESPTRRHQSERKPDSDIEGYSISYKEDQRRR